MSLDGNQLRARYNKRFRALSTLNSPFVGVLIVAVDLLAISCIAAFNAWVFIIHSTTIAVAIFPLAIILIGFRLRSFGNIIHECTHMTFVDGRQWNRAIGKILAILLFTSFERYRADHMTHHLYTGDYDKDRDFAESKHFGFENALTFKEWRRLLGWLFTFEFYSIYVGTTLNDQDENTSWRLLRFAYFAALVALVIPVFSGSIFSWIILGFWILPLATTLPAIGFMSDIMDHAGLIGNNTELDKSRNYIVKNPIVKWLFFPRNDVFHLTHHIFPQVPVRSVYECHLILLDECPEYRAHKHTFGEWWAYLKDRGNCKPLRVG